jgi:hypothetical protein
MHVHKVERIFGAGPEWEEARFRLDSGIYKGKQGRTQDNA